MAKGAGSFAVESTAEPRRAIAQPICVALPELLDRWRWQIFFTIAAAYLLAFNGQWLVEPDGGLYLNLARNLALGRGYTYGGIHHETVYPGLPVALAGLYRIFSPHIIFAADVFIFLCAFASLALVYRLILLAYDRPTAVLITVGVAFSHEFFQYSFEILTDMPFLMGVMAVLAGHEAIFGPRARGARWWDWALLGTGVMVAITTRPTMIGLLLAWVIALLVAVAVYRNGKAAAALIFCAVIVGTFLLVDPRRFAGHGVAGGYEQYAIYQLSHAHVLAVTAAANIHALLAVILAKSAFGMRLWPMWANVVLGLIVSVAAVALIAKRLFWGLWVILTLLTVILFVSNDRYLLPILPMMVLGWWTLVCNINLRLHNRFGNLFAGFLLLLGTGPNIAQVMGTILHQRTRPFLATYQNGRYESFTHIAPAVARETATDDVLLCPPKTARMMAFLADRMCFEENEPFPIPKHLFVIADPADADYVTWLRVAHIQLQDPPLARVSRRGNQPAIFLFHARIAAEK